MTRAVAERAAAANTGLRRVAPIGRNVAPRMSAALHFVDVASEVFPPAVPSKEGTST
jgi:hypothetical protein